jgi:transcriptional antiterminator RfaH
MDVLTGDIRQDSRMMTMQMNWYVVYTRPRFEKKVFSLLSEQNIKAYLPMQTTIRQWNDRKKKVSVPLFSGYVFVFISTRDYYQVLNIQGVVRYVSFEGKAVAIPEKQIRLIQNLLEQDMEASDFEPQLSAGTRVEITAGPLMGITGELVEYSGKKRVIIGIEEIGKTLMVQVPLHYLVLKN